MTRNYVDFRFTSALNFKNLAFPTILSFFIDITGQYYFIESRILDRRNV